MSDEPVYVGGGFDSSRSAMSEDLQIRLAAADAIQADEDAKAERARKQRVEALQERAQQAAIAAALAEGQAFSPKMLRGEGLGHRPSEFIAQRAAMMDIEDAHAEAQAAAEYRRWQAEHYAATSADTSAPTSLQLEEGAQMQARARRHREREYERERAVREARRLAAQDAARGDRKTLGLVAAVAAEALGGEAGSQTGYRSRSAEAEFRIR
jgi:hypothetical protein